MNRITMRPLFFALAILVSGCVMGEESAKKNTGSGTATAVKKGKPTKEQPTEKAKQATPSVASVRLAQDCPDPPPAGPKKSQRRDESPAMGAPSRRARSRGPFRQPCSQSSLQLAFADHGETSSPVVVKEVRLLSAADGQEPLAVLQTRRPGRWNGNGYEEWDSILPANSSLKASYKLSVPSWSEVEAKLGGASHGRMYRLEVDVDIGGIVTTVRSGKFERERAQIIRT